MTAQTPPPEPALRADAARNRQRLIEAANEIFMQKGTAATLDEIAKAAGVGIGTLYRHFPHRDALVETVYRQAMENLLGMAERLGTELPPLEALRAWLNLFVDHLVTKKLMAGLLASLVNGPEALYSGLGERLKEALATLIARARAEGAIAGEGPARDMDPIDLLRALAGVANQGPEVQWEASARRLIDILIAGLRS